MAAKKGGKPKGKATAPKSQKPKIAKPTKPAIEHKPALPVPAEEPRKRGGQTVYTPEIGEKLLTLLASGKTLTSICKADDMPSAPTVIRWATDPDNPFAEQYARARLVGYTVMGDDFIDIADNVSENNAAIMKARLKSENRKWFLARMLPKVFGDKLAITDPEGGTFKVQVVA